MKKVKLLLLSVLCTVAAHAQLGNAGYYRIQNASTERFISPSDNYGYNEPGTTIVDVSALKTVVAEGVETDPGAVIYIKAEGDGYNLLGQGYQTCDVFPGHPYLKIWDNGDNTYKAYMTEGSVSVYLVEGDGQCMTSKNKSLEKADWKIIPVDEDNYFGVAPDIEAGDYFYKSFFAAFPFKVASEGLKAYAITEVDMNGFVTVEETQEVAGATPVIFKSTSDEVAKNLLTIGEEEPALTSATEYNDYIKQIDLEDGVHGAYFCNPVTGNHRNVIEYDPATMRVLGKDDNGNPAFITAPLQYVPANTAFIKVKAGSPATFRIVEKGQQPEQVAGDLNHDNVLDIFDYNILVQMINNIIPVTAEGDINGDGEVTVADARMLYNMILNAED